MEENLDVEQEVVEPSDQELVPEPEQSPEELEPQKGSHEYNFRELRTVMDRQQRRINELEAAANSKEPEPESYEALDEDDFLTVKQMNKMLQKQATGQLEDKMRIRHKDYDDVVTTENVKQFIENDADILDSIKNASNPYATAYKLLKKLAVPKAPKEVRDNKAANLEKIQKNSQKPGTSNAISSKPLAQVNSYASMGKSEKDALYREMMEFASRR